VRVIVVQAVTGMRGVGKTHLVAAYARARLAERWRLVAWINAEDRTSTLTGLTEVADALGLIDDEASQGPSENFGRIVRHWLETDGDRCLLVFDNATDADVLRPLIPAGGAARILITSTRQSMANLGASVSVEVFTVDEAITFLIDQTGFLDSEGAAAVAAELGFLPLALGQAAAVIARQRISYQTYLERLREFPVRQYLVREDGHLYPHGMAEAVLLSLSLVQAGPHGDICITAMEFISLLSPSGIYRNLLYDAGSAGSLSIDGLVMSAAVVDEALARLVEWSLLAYSRAGDGIIAHRLIMRVIREGLAKTGRLTRLCRNVALMLDARAGAFAGSLDHPTIRDIVDQVAALRDSVDDPSCRDDAELARLLLGLRLWVLYFLNELGDSPEQAIEIGREVTIDFERLLGPDHPETLNSRNNLAEAYRAAGLNSDAIPLYEKNLAACERQEEAGVRLVALIARNNLATSYQEVGRLAEAIPLYEQNVANYERLFDPDHPAAVASRRNLAAARRAAGLIE
jgi:tetratricopeptide repeat protein/NB-ARC domain-containing protein